MAPASTQREYDYVIVGSGSAGSVLAARLSENPDVSVLLVEAGRDDRYVWMHVPVGYLYCINNPRADWCFQTVKEPGLNGRSLIYPRGLGLGGCSLINGMIYMRGHDRDYDGWAEALGDDSWRWEHMLPLFKRHEDYRGSGAASPSAAAFHGSGGPWTVSKQRLRWDVLEVFRQAAVDAGIPDTDDFNRGNNFGVGYFDVSQRDGWRLSAYRAFVHGELSQRPNLTVLGDTRVHRLRFGDGSDPRSTACTGIVASIRGSKQLETIIARQEVILSAGSIGSVQVLERSGIGREDVLTAAGVEVRHHLPGVGENLQDHLQLRMSFAINDTLPTLNTMYQSYWQRAAMGFEYLLRRSGPLSMAPSQLGAFFMSSPDVPRPDLEYHVQPLSLPKFGDDLDSMNAITASVCNLRPTSKGSVHIASDGELCFVCRLHCFLFYVLLILNAPYPFPSRSGREACHPTQLPLHGGGRGRGGAVAAAH
jgi:choline dehydrogenase